ncbi:MULTISPECIES: GntR family transcriptional regulator [Promicromonospora]|uniref:GntR family transcriptional regulator n=2 Tax=Promicromonospora TaxID=43676 RepID=A0ABW4V3G6_9MICO
MAVSGTQAPSIKARIADDLRRKIVDGELAPGDRLPTLVTLTEAYKVAPMTVREALGILKNEGLVISRGRHGTIVRDLQRMTYRPQSDLTLRPDDVAKDLFLSEQESDGRRPTQTIDIAIVQPPPEVADRLPLADGELAVVRRRVRYLEDEPYLTNDSYFPFSIAEGTEIMSPDDIARGANVVLAEKGYVQDYARDEITVRMPTREEQQRLALMPGVPVAHQVTTGYDRNGRALRVAVTVLPGDRHVIVLERPGIPDSGTVR